MTATPEHARDLALRRVYGITLEEYKAIVAAQGHRCPVCLKPLEGISNPVDHDHVTGVVRGVLHTYCNHRIIGRHRDWELLHRAAMYLKENPARRAIGHRQVPKKKPKARKKPSGTTTTTTAGSKRSRTARQ